MTKKDIIKELDVIFEVYKNIIIDEVIKNDGLTYKFALLTSVLNRSNAIIEGYKKVLSTNNIIVLNSLIRMQIDNCIFVYGLYLLNNDGHKSKDLFLNIVKSNKKLSEYKIKKNKLYDTYIVEQINNEYKNKFLEAYNFYCRFIHFSDGAITSSMYSKENNVLELELVKEYSRFKPYIITNSITFIEVCKFLVILIKNKWTNLDDEVFS